MVTVSHWHEVKGCVSQIVHLLAEFAHDGLERGVLVHFNLDIAPRHRCVHDLDRQLSLDHLLFA